MLYDKIIILINHLAASVNKHLWIRFCKVKKRLLL